ncbi:hypothetical protein WKH15_21520 [Pantoea agglomerans]|uniref:hypothetical protein n=1 Tax=Enterobacter agglomerans TaxID=549 RepID=UPI003C7ABF2E
MATIFSAKLVESQLPILTRRSTILKRVMWAGIGIALACLIPTLYFSYSAADVNSVSHFAYDFPKNLLDWSGTLPVKDGVLAVKVNSLFDTLFSIIAPLTAVLGITGCLYIFYCLIRGEEISGAIRHFLAVVFMAGAAYTGKGILGIDDNDTKTQFEDQLVSAFSQRDAVTVLKLIKENPEFLNNQVTGHTDVTKFFEDLSYLEIQKDLKEGHLDARKTERFVQSSYFIKGSKSFRPDVLTAIEKVAYGHPASERAEQYQTSVIEPELRRQHILAALSASLMTLGFITGAGAFVLSRIIRRRVSFLKTSFSAQAKSL